MGLPDQSELRCRTGSSPSLSSSWKSSHTPHPRLTSSTLGQPSTPPSDYIQSPGEPSIASWQTISRRPNPPRDPFTLYPMFFDFCLFNCHTHVLVISPTHYYVTLYNIIHGHSVKVILTCCDSAYPFTAVVPYPVVCIYIYLPCVAV